MRPCDAPSRTRKQEGPPLTDEISLVELRRTGLLICPTGKSVKWLSSPVRKNISLRR
jgi:hypothetical protein